MPCPVTGGKQCHCKCPSILSQIAQKHDVSPEDAAAGAHREHFECMKSELCCDFTDQQFADAHQLCTDHRDKPFHSEQ